MAWSWWRSRFVELGASVLIVSAVITASGTVMERQKALTPASSWLVINEIYVPDFEVAHLPDIIYDRVVLERFDGFWIVEVQAKNEHGLWVTDCSGSGVHDYDPATVIPDNTVSWKWYIARDCRPPPGVYRLKTSVTMSRPNWPDKRVFNLSNEFRVLTPTEMLNRGLEFCPTCGKKH